MLIPLPFVLSASLYSANIERIQKQTFEVNKIARKAGTDNPQFKQAWEYLYSMLQGGSWGNYKPRNRFDIRAMAVALQANTNIFRDISVTSELLAQVDAILTTPSSLFIDALFQFFLYRFDSIEDVDAVGAWLVNARKSVKSNEASDQFLLNIGGPAWLAKAAIADQMPFQQQLRRCGLSNFASGDFVKRAQYIYYVEQLQQIPVNEDHEILHEVSKSEVFEARYDGSQLLGHVILKTLINRAPQQNISPAWQNVIITIAGDPRIPSHHPRFIQWWSHLPAELVAKVKGWLSKFDLKLFLDALHDLSISSRDEDMMRMYPSRKHFLEGMYEAGAILETKLYLSRHAEHYIKKNYKPEHRPDYSLVTDGDRSIIYARLTQGHMIEGSHNCQIWFYDKLPDNVFFNEYGKQRLTYRDLTNGFNEKMIVAGCPAKDNFYHYSTNFNWQNKAISTLKRMGVSIRAADVLSADDYQRYKRLYGAY